MEVRVQEDTSWREHWQPARDTMLENLGVDVLADAKRYVAVHTGRLRNSLEAAVQDGVLEVGSTDVEYSVDQELGTSTMHAHPYLQPAMYQHRELR